MTTRRTRGSTIGHSQKLALRLIVTLLALVTLLPVSGCATKTFQYGRVSRVRWFLTIAQKQGENLHDVTVYVPFPRKKGEPLPELLREVRARTSRLYPQADSPQIELSVVKTRFGEMLKVSVSKMYQKTEGESGGVIPGGEYVYATVLPIGRADSQYPLEPTVVAEQQKKAPIFVDYQGGTGLYLWLVYAAQTADMYVPVMPTSIGTTWVVGKSMTTSQYGDPTVYEDDRILIDKRGWNQIPVWTSQRLM